VPDIPGEEVLAGQRPADPPRMKLKNKLFFETVLKNLFCPKIYRGKKLPSLLFAGTQPPLPP
jgi:hypothetical protein